jgi:hypothetical protein
MSSRNQNERWACTCIVTFNDLSLILNCILIVNPSKIKVRQNNNEKFSSYLTENTTSLLEMLTDYAVWSEMLTNI